MNNIQSIIDQNNKEFEEKCKRWTKSQREGGACACLGDCQVCLFNFKAHLKERDAKLLAGIREMIEDICLEMENAQLSYDRDIDITELPEGLIAEMTGLKKGYRALQSQILSLLPETSDKEIWY